MFLYEKNITLFLFLTGIILFSVFSYAETVPSPMITSYKYSVGDKMKDEEIRDVQIGKKIQLYVVVATGSESMFLGTKGSWFVDEINLTNVNWKSSNSNIATVDNSGKVTGIAQGNVTIVAQGIFQDGTFNCEYDINVAPHSQKNYFTLLILSLIAISLICIVISIIIYKKKNK